MGKVTAAIAIMALAISLISCAPLNKPTQLQIDNADYGSCPGSYKELIESRVKRRLIDPYSAVFSEWRGPSKGYFYDINGSYFGYRVCCEVNAKNRMGGYTGSQPFYFLIRNGQVIKQEGGYRYGTIGAERVSSYCNFY